MCACSIGIGCLVGWLVEVIALYQCMYVAAAEGCALNKKSGRYALNREKSFTWKMLCLHAKSQNEP